MNPKKYIEEAVHEFRQLNVYLKSIAISLQKIANDKKEDDKNETDDRK